MTDGPVWSWLVVVVVVVGGRGWSWWVVVVVVVAWPQVESLKGQGITHVLDLGGMTYTKHTQHFRYLTIDIEDDARADLARHFGRTNAFIDEARRSGGGVLVHCQACISRSPAVVVAYLIHEHRGTADPMDVDAALALVRTVRHQARPNEGFMRQLRHFHAEGASGASGVEEAVVGNGPEAP